MTVRMFSEYLTFTVISFYISFLSDIVKSSFGNDEVIYLDRLLNGHIDYLPRIPPHLIVAILQHVDLPDILNFHRINKKFNQVCSNYILYY